MNASLPPLQLAPATLVGDAVRLEPLRAAHLDDLCAVGLDPALSEYTSVSFADRAALAAWIAQGEKGEASGRFLPFAIIDTAAGRAVGAIVLGPVSPHHRSAELSIWLGTAHRGGRLSIEYRLLLLRHAFETLGLIRIEFRADPGNARSVRAIRGLGAREEGRLRKCRISDRGRVFDSLVFSLIDDDWRAVEAQLLRKLAWWNRRAARVAPSP